PRSPVEVHLEQPVLGGDVSLQIPEVVLGLRVDVRHAVAVAEDLATLIDAQQAKVAVDRRKRAVNEDETGDDHACDEKDGERARLGGCIGGRSLTHWVRHPKGRRIWSRRWRDRKEA